MSFWEYLILFISVIAGGTFAFYLKSYNKNSLQLVLSFSGSYILGITVLHLMPSVFSLNPHTTGYWIIGGFLIQLLMERLSAGIEHGHIHAHEKGQKHIAIPIMLGLCLHAFIEGLPLSYYPEFHDAIHSGEHEHQHLFYGIILHKIPAAFALVLLLILSKLPKGFIFSCLFIFAMMSPLGAYLATLISFDTKAISNLVALVIGSFLHISTTILFEVDNTHHHKISWTKFLIILTGMGMALFTV